MRKLSHSTFLTYLFTYLAILIIPLAILSTLLFTKGNELISKELLQKESITIHTRNTLLTQGLEECSNVNLQIQMQSTIKPFHLNQEVTRALDTIKLFATYTNTHHFFDGILVHYYGSDHLYSNLSSMLLDSFFQQYRSATLTPLQFKEKLYSTKFPTVITGIKHNGQNCFLYVMPILKPYLSHGFLAFVIDENKLFSLLGHDENDSRLSFFLDTTTLKEDLKRLNLHEQLGLSLNEFYTLLDSVEPNSLYTSPLLNDSIIYVSRPNTSNLLYLTISPHTQIFKSLISLQAIIITGIIIALISSLLAIIFALDYNYKPLLQLKTFASMCLPISSTERSDDLAIIKHTLVSLTKQNQFLQNELDQDTTIKQYFLLNQLINGNCNRETYTEECEAVSINLIAPYHTIMVVKSLDTSSISGPQFTSHLTSMQNFTHYYTYLIRHTVPDIYIFVVGSDRNFDQSSIPSHTMTTYVAKSCTQLKHLPTSYIEIRSYVDLNGQPIDLANKDFKAFFSSWRDAGRSIFKLLEKGEFVATEDLINQVICDSKKYHLPFEVIRNLYFEIILLFNRYFEKNKQAFNYVPTNLNTLYELDNTTELEEVFTALLSEMIEILTQQVVSETPKLCLDVILKDINTHYTDPTFSLQLLADKYQVSLSYLSQFFKDKYHMTILDYLTHLRMEKAKDLLLTTTLPLKPISEQVGYLNVSSFIRRFKQVTGMTPGEYKKQAN